MNIRQVSLDFFLIKKQTVKAISIYVLHFDGLFFVRINWKSNKLIFLTLIFLILKFDESSKLKDDFLVHEICKS